MVETQTFIKLSINFECGLYGLENHILHTYNFGHVRLSLAYDIHFSTTSKTTTTIGPAPSSSTKCVDKKYDWDFSINDYFNQRTVMMI